jgi:hypothetical protein
MEKNRFHHCAVSSWEGDVIGYGANDNLFCVGNDI